MKAEVQALMDKARQSLEAARLLHAEGYVDFAASRAYYAMFYATEALLLKQGQSFSSHSATVAAFGKLFAKTGALDARYHRYLIDAQDTRNLGDYGIGPGVTSDQAQRVLERAEEFINAVQQLLEGS